MGTRGPLPRPVPSRVRYPDQAPASPPPPREPPPRPAGLSPAAADLWGQLAPELCAAGLLTPLDAPAFVALCESYAAWSRLVALLRAAEPAYQPEGGAMLKRHPLAPLVSMAARDLRVWLLEFGLTPQARLRLGIELPAAEAAGGKARFFAG